MLLKIFSISILAFFPLASSELQIDSNFQCAVCQFLSVAAAKDNKTDNSNLCQKIQNCQSPLSDCQILSTLHSATQQFGKTDLFRNFQPKILSTLAVCQTNSSSELLVPGSPLTRSIGCVLTHDLVKYTNNFIVKEPRKNENFEKSIQLCHAFEAVANTETSESMMATYTTPQCALCFLVYDTLKYINYNILESPLLGNVEQLIEFACDSVLSVNPDLCMALLGTDALPAIIRALQESLGGFYDLIAVHGFGCPAYQVLFDKC